jgi:hypothetical protein
VYGNENAKGTLTLRIGKSGYFLESPETTCFGGEILWGGPGEPQQPNSAGPDRKKEVIWIIPTTKKKNTGSMLSLLPAIHISKQFHCLYKVGRKMDASTVAQLASK